MVIELGSTVEAESTRRPLATPRVRTSRGWRRALDGVLSDPAQPRLVYQPIVDLARGVVAGYECLARFADTVPGASTEEWFSWATRTGRGAALEASILARALQARPSIPAPRFLSVNIGPQHLASPEIATALAVPPDLTGVVIELTEHGDAAATPGVRDLLADLRARGALVALDDAGAGYAGLAALLTIRPDILKIDRLLVQDVDRDPAKRATVELLGGLASTLDSWVVAEGVERAEELDTLLTLGVPLAQGWLLGVPSDQQWAELPPLLASRLRRLTTRAARPSVAQALLVSAPYLPADQRPAEASGQAQVEVDHRGCPLRLHVPGPCGRLQARTTFLLTHPEAGVVELAKRAMTRELECRFDPLVCIDESGRYIGLLPVDALVTALTHLQPDALGRRAGHPRERSAMKTFACGDVIPGCTARFRATDERALMDEVAVHAARAHGIGDMSPELVGTVREHIATVA